MFSKGCGFTDDSVMTIAVGEALLAVGTEATVKKIEEASGYLRIVLFAYTLGSMPFALKRNAKYDIDGTRNYSCQKRSLKHVGVW